MGRDFSHGEMSGGNSLGWVSRSPCRITSLYV